MKTNQTTIFKTGVTYISFSVSVNRTYIYMIQHIFKLQPHQQLFELNVKKTIMYIFNV